VAKRLNWERRNDRARVAGECSAPVVAIPNIGAWAITPVTTEQLKLVRLLYMRLYTKNRTHAGLVRVRQFLRRGRNNSHKVCLSVVAHLRYELGAWERMWGET